MIIWFLTAVLASPAPSRATSLVGLWETTTTSREGIGHTLEFRADGTCVEATAVMVNEFYRLIGDRLVQGETPVVPDADVSKSSRIELDGGVLTQTGPDGAVVRKERMGTKTAKSGLVGVWRYRHATNMTAFERYTADGRMAFRIPMVSSVGRYTLKNDEIVLVRPNQPDATMAIDLQADTLTIASGGHVTHYRRDAAGPWYDREHIDPGTPK